MDKITLKRIKCKCIVGVLEFERNTKQDIFVSLELGGDYSKACQNDKIEDALDYRFVEELKDWIESSDYFLIEKLAEEVATKCLDQKLIKKVKVIIEKPSALPFAENTVVEIKRKKK